jgi:hypothetical protein
MRRKEGSFKARETERETRIEATHKFRTQTDMPVDLGKIIITTNILTNEAFRPRYGQH